MHDRVDTLRLLSGAIAGLVGGTVATIMQMGVWALQGEPAWLLLLRDARLAAAVLLGPAVLPPPAGWSWSVMAAATGVHLAVSLLYGVLLALMLGRDGALRAVIVGTCYGAAVYGVNLHAFTAIWPWFAASRGMAALVAHLAFGASAAGTLVVLRSQARAR